MRAAELILREKGNLEAREITIDDQEIINGKSSGISC